MSQGLGQVLVQQGVLTQDGLSRAEQARVTSGKSLGQALVELQLASEEQIVSAVAATIGVEFVTMRPGEVDPMAAGLLPREAARRLQALPVQFGEGNEIVVAVLDPSNQAALQEVRAITGMEVTPALAVRDSLLNAIEHLADRSGEPDQAGPPPAAPAQGASMAAQMAAQMAEPPAAPGTAPGTAPVETRPKTNPQAVAKPVPTQSGDKLAYEEESAFDLDAALMSMVEKGASDLHLTSGIPPAIRVSGDLEHMTDFAVLDPKALQTSLYSIMTQKQREEFENELELDLAYSLPGIGRFRVNIFMQRESIGSVMRQIPFEILPLEELGVPAQVANFCFAHRGMVLVTGPTGSGKSTTLASMIDIINRERAGHIMTVEDPIEFLHKHKKSIVNQRELNTDTHSFKNALKHVLRQDPDVILVGELRDLETIQLAITAAETGHLVFGTLHTQDAPQTVDRIIDVFPPEQQEQIRVMLATSLNGVVTQTLLKKADGSGRAVSCEIMVATPAIRNLIREGKTHQMYSSIQAGKQHGMISMDQSLAELVNRGTVAYAHALEKAASPADFNRLCGRS